MDKLKLGVSACLLGQRVRYDGQHKLDRFITETLGRYVDFVPVCPEVECGLPVPRETMRLEGDPEAPRLMTHKSRRDLTDQMLSWCRCRIEELESEDLRGFIFKSKSPSSGMERVKVYNGKGGLSGRSSGLFAREFMRHFPLLPVEDEGRLHDPDIRENFITRIFTLNRYREATAGRVTAAALTTFHARHKLLLMAHSQENCRRMGRMLASADGKAAELRPQYEAELLKTLKLMATPRKHVNVMQHMLGYFKQELTTDEKAEMLELIDRYKQGLLPHIVPLTMLQHYVRKYAVDYLATQYYLDPHPVEAILKSHA